MKSEALSWKPPKGLLENQHNATVLTDAVYKHIEQGGGKLTHAILDNMVFENEQNLQFEVGRSPREIWARALRSERRAITGSLVPERAGESKWQH